MANLPDVSSGAFAAVKTGGAVVSWGDSGSGGDCRAVQAERWEVREREREREREWTRCRPDVLVDCRSQPAPNIASPSVVRHTWRDTEPAPAPTPGYTTTNYWLLPRRISPAVISITTFPISSLVFGPELELSDLN